MRIGSESGETLFTYNMKLRPKYGRDLSRFQIFRPSLRTKFGHRLSLMMIQSFKRCSRKKKTTSFRPVKKQPQSMSFPPTSASVSWILSRISLNLRRLWIALLSYFLKWSTVFIFQRAGFLNLEASISLVSLVEWNGMFRSVQLTLVGINNAASILWVAMLWVIVNHI